MPISASSRVLNLHMASWNFFFEEFVLRSLISSPLIKPLLTASGRVTRGIVCILKGLDRLVVSFDVEGSFI